MEQRMIETFFTRLKAETPTRVWVNNPTLDEVDLAIAQGAVGCTTNPAFGASVLKRAPAEIRPMISECLAISEDDARVADVVQQRLVARIADRFASIHEETGQRLGFVSIQGSPDVDGDAQSIEEEAREGRALAPNVAPKLPATGPGLAAFERLVERGSPTIVTEVFSIAQLVETCERYIRAAAQSGQQPPFFLSPITGIFGDHLKAVAVRENLDISDSDMEQAGVALSKACYRLVRERAYPVRLLCGGARIPSDLTGLVGGELHATINWSTFAEITDSRTRLVRAIDQPVDRELIGRLEATFEDVRLAMSIDGLAVDEFEAFAPVQHFRNAFVAGWSALRSAIAEERAALVTG
jgi:transaldolase